MSNPKTISWNRSKLTRFKKAYSLALRKVGRDGVFEFEGHEFVVGYSGYLIEYLNTLFNGHTNPNRN